MDFVSAAIIFVTVLVMLAVLWSVDIFGRRLLLAVLHEIEKLGRHPTIHSASTEPPRHRVTLRRVLWGVEPPDEKEKS